MIALNRTRSFFLLALCMFAMHFLFAQNKTITGKVISDKGEPLQGVTVTIKNTGKATTTNANGVYTVSADGAKPVLVFTMVGYAPMEVSYSGNNTLDVSLQGSSGAMDEVVVVGYGTVKKSDVTGSVVSLKASELTPGANVNVQQIMQGRASGVQVYQKSGEPGSAMSVKIRGVSSISAGNDPLYVIDGMPVNDAAPVSGTGAGFVANPNPRNPLNSLNPSDIESIEILKDASATAIYGSRGANGVVLITTKKGASGSLNVGYNGYYGFQEVANRVEVLNGQQYHDVLNAIIAAGGGSAAERVSDNYVSTDWQDQLYRKAATQSHDISLSGGNNNNRFYASFGYFDQEGVVKTSGIQRYTARLNYTNSLAKRYAFGINLATSYIKDKINSVGTGVNEQASALYASLYYDPTVPVYAPDGSIFRSTFMNMDNPVALINGQYAISDAYRTFGTAYGEYFMIPSLSAKVRIGGDINQSQRNVWIDPITTAGAQAGGIASILTGARTYYMAEGTLNYNKSAGIHAVNAVAGFTYERFGSNTFSGDGRGYALPDLSYNAIGSGVPTLNGLGSGRASTKLISYLSRINYSLLDKYLVTISFRADGSSRFGPDNSFGYFPSGALAWKMHEEKFMDRYQFIDELKLRVSYGAIGNQNISNYLYISTFANGRNATFNSTRYNSIAPTRNPNAALKWEAALQGDIGIDFSLWKKKVQGSIEYYSRRTTDLLLGVPLPLSTGFNSRTENIGSMKNSGVDIQLSVGILKYRNFKWDINGNISFLKNKVVSLGPSSRIITGAVGFISDAAIITPGQSIASYYGYDIIGVWQQKDDFTTTSAGVKPGDLKYKDQNGDKQITDADRIILGKPLPDYTYGITNTFSYNKLSLSFYIEGSEGASVLNTMLVDTYYPISFRRNKVAAPYVNRWTPDNPTDEYPSFVNPTSQGQRRINSKTVENASYVRLQSARLSYSLPAIRKMNAVSIYVTGQNLFTITKYSGVDPSVNAVGDDILKIDYASYPFSRTFLIGANIQF